MTPTLFLLLLSYVRGVVLDPTARPVEGAKIACGKAHFEALAVNDNPARYVVATSLDDVLKAP